MDLLVVREALRLLRLQSGIGVRGINGLDKSTVHRIENAKKNPRYSPELDSVARIVEACGSTLTDFFKKLDALTPTRQAHPDLLAELADEQTVRQVLGFLRLPAPAREAMALIQPQLSAPAQPQTAGPALVPTRAARPTPRSAKHRRSGPRKTGT